MLAELVNGNGGASQGNEYLAVGNVKVGMRVERSDETVSLRYFHTDHLGLIAVITDENALVVERLSYDAWGKRRFASGADDPTGSIASQTTRGFTGHEHLAEVGLVHMNGRVYDPLVARMMSADPTVPDAMNPQAWNRYSYVGNDPLAFTDPSGYSWLSNFFRSIGNAIKSAFQQIPILRAVVQIAIAAILGPVGMGLNIAVAAALSAAVVTGLSGGKLGDMLKAGAIAGATAFAFHVAGDLTGFFPGAPNGGHAALNPGSPAHLFNIASHAAVGCGAAVASGGRCSEGALSAGVGSAAGPFIPTKDFTARLVTLSVVGGTASVAGGGKFENGAVTAAFGYMFNEMGDYWANVPAPAGGDQAPAWVRGNVPGMDSFLNFTETGNPLWLVATAAEMGTFGGIAAASSPWRSLSANPFRGRTAEEIAEMLAGRGYLPKGQNPVIGRGTFVNPNTGRGYHIDAGHPLPKGPHVGVHRLRGFRDILPTKDYPL